MQRGDEQPGAGLRACFPLGREYEGSTQHAGDIRIRGIAILGVILVDALEIGPKQRRSMPLGRAGQPG